MDNYSGGGNFFGGGYVGMYEHCHPWQRAGGVLRRTLVPKPDFCLDGALCVSGSFQVSPAGKDYFIAQFYYGYGKSLCVCNRTGNSCAFWRAVFLHYGSVSHIYGSGRIY